MRRSRYQIGATLVLVALAVMEARGQAHDQVYRLLASSCGPSGNLFSQSGFRTRIKGQVGLVTALHGVVGCARVVAVQEDELGNSYISDLELVDVSVPHDAAFFRSRTLARLAGSGLRPNAASTSGRLRVIGYPQESRRQTQHPLELFDNARTTLSAQFRGSKTARELERRNSPSTAIDVLMLRGVLQSGYSGAPVLMSDGSVIAIASGGLARGFAQINWAIPFVGIPWQRYSPDRRDVHDLIAMDATRLFHSPWTGFAERPAGGATIRGSILYDNRLATRVTPAYAVMQLMEVSARRLVPIVFDYDNVAGTFTISDVPPGKYTPFVRLEAGYPFHVESGGDYHSRLSGLNQDIVVAPHDRELRVNLKVTQGIHLTHPVDNQQRRTRAGDSPELLYVAGHAPSAERFQWAPVPGAAYYKVIILTVRGRGQAPLSVIDERVSGTRFMPGLPVSPPGTRYMFRVEARNGSDGLIGDFTNYYLDGSGGWFEFQVRAAPGRSQVNPGQALMSSLSSSASNNPLDDPKVRKALRLAGESNDLDGAKRLLAEAGFRQGFALDLSLTRFVAAGGHERNAHELVERLRRIGVTVRVSR